MVQVRCPGCGGDKFEVYNETFRASEDNPLHDEVVDIRIVCVRCGWDKEFVE